MAINHTATAWLCRRAVSSDRFEDFKTFELWWALDVVSQRLSDLETKIDRGRFDATLSNEIDRMRILQEHVGRVLECRLSLRRAA